jgi:hypothetical protein
MKQHLRHRIHAAMTGLRVEIMSLALPFAAHSEDKGEKQSTQPRAGGGSQLVRSGAYVAEHSRLWCRLFGKAPDPDGRDYIKNVERLGKAGYRRLPRGDVLMAGLCRVFRVIACGIQAMIRGCNKPRASPWR